MTSLVFIRLMYVFFLFKPFMEKPFSIEVKVDRRVKGTCTLTYFNSKGKILKNKIHVNGTSFTLNGKVEGYFTGADLQLKVRDIKNHVFLSKEYKINLEDKNLIVSLSGDSLKNLTYLNNFTDREVLNFKKSIDSIDHNTNKNLLKEKIINWCLANQSQNSSAFFVIHLL